MLDKINNLNSQTRILLAVLLALAFFVPYSYFYQPAQEPPKEVTKAESQTPSVQAPADSTALAIRQDSATQANANSAIIATINAQDFIYEIDTLGRISKVLLKEVKYQKDSKPLSLFTEDISNQNNPKILEIRFLDSVLNNQAYNTPYTASEKSVELQDTPKTITLTQNLNNITVQKILTFYPNGYYKAEFKIPENYIYFVSPGMRPSVENDSYVFKGVIVKESDDTITTVEDGDAQGQSNFANAKIIAAVDRYYTTLLFDEKGLSATILSNAGENPMPFISGNGDLSVEGYIGPKNYRLLESINPTLTDVVEYGVITFFAKPLFLLLDKLYDFCGNWGWAIILLTLIVRIVLYPLTYKGMVSMQKF